MSKKWSEWDLKRAVRELDEEDPDWYEKAEERAKLFPNMDKFELSNKSSNSSNYAGDPNDPFAEIVGLITIIFLLVCFIGIIIFLVIMLL